jgi:hypothetical protein
VVLEMQPGTGVPVKSDSGTAATDGPATAVAPTAAASTVVKEPVKAPVKAAVKPVAHAAAPAKAKAAGSAGAVSASKKQTGNGKIFADLAAARRAREVRAKHAAGVGER